MDIKTDIRLARRYIDTSIRSFEKRAEEDPECPSLFYEALGFRSALYAFEVDVNEQLDRLEKVILTCCGGNRSTKLEEKPDGTTNAA